MTGRVKSGQTRPPFSDSTFEIASIFAEFLYYITFWRQFKIGKDTQKGTVQKTKRSQWIAAAIRPETRGWVRVPFARYVLSRVTIRKYWLRLRGKLRNRQKVYKSDVSFVYFLRGLSFMEDRCCQPPIPEVRMSTAPAELCIMHTPLSKVAQYFKRLEHKNTCVYKMYRSPFILNTSRKVRVTILCCLRIFKDEHILNKILEMGWGVREHVSSLNRQRKRIKCWNETLSCP